MNTRITWLAAAILAVVAAPAAAQQNITRRATVAPDVTIEVSHVQGPVGVVAWDKYEVELVAVLESVKDELEFGATPRKVRIEVERPAGHHGRNQEDANLVLRAPRGARLEIETVSADIAVTGVHGPQALESVSGEVRTQAFDAPVSAAAVSGDVTVTGTGGKAAVDTSNVSGTSTVTGVRGEFQGAVVSGEIQATVAAATNVEISTVSGEVTLNAELAPAGEIDMETVNGALALNLKPPVNADFDLESFSGDIEVCFGPKSRSTRKYTPGSELVFTQGEGGARVQLESLSGEIRVCDR
ncbi:MAG: hypothetical protein FJ171_10195 [Gammaproteobacteria bacterium]|nr:hypothetical protein [Gammaproteobacteria bacterium]